MIALWMLYTIGIATLLGLSALAVEQALRSRDRPARGVWMGAMLASWAFPLGAWWFPKATPSAGSVGGVPAGTAGDLPAIAATEVASLGSWAMEGLAATDPWLGWLLLGSGLLASALLVSSLTRLTRRVGRWPIREVQGQGVSVSPAFGPVVVGVRRPRIVLPSWVLTLAEAQQRLIVRHEHEHREGRDPALLTLGALLVMAAPWNPALWWQMRRFRLATELDCDRRVVAGGASPRQYGELLLDVGRRQVGDAWPLAALAEPPSFLERRLRMIARRGENDRRWKAALMLAGGLGLLVGACETPVPPPPEEPLEQEVVVPEDGVFTVEAVELAPLIIVDGVITGMDLTDLEAMDIESIEVVKGATAAELFGERAANGVVQITTKSGARAKFQQALDEVTEAVREHQAQIADMLSRREEGAVEEFEVPAEPASTFKVRDVRFGDEVEPRPEIAPEPDLSRYRLREVPPIRELEPEEPTSTIRLRGVARFGPAEDASAEFTAVEVPSEATADGLEIVGSDRPLIIVDGVITDRSLAEISAEGIDRIEVVKGAAAAKLYGSRAANGVVQIFTKRRNDPAR